MKQENEWTNNAKEISFYEEGDLGAMKRADLGYQQEGRQANVYRGRWQRDVEADGKGLCASVFLPEIRSRATG